MLLFSPQSLSRVLPRPPPPHLLEPVDQKLELVDLSLQGSNHLRQQLIVHVSLCASVSRALIPAGLRGRGRRGRRRKRRAVLQASARGIRDVS